MRRNNRRAVRSAIGAKAWIRADGGFSVQACRVNDISNTGVRVSVDAPNAVANRFSLLMTRDAGPGRRCRVVWRRGKEIGAEFE